MRSYGLNAAQVDTLGELVDCWGKDRFALIGARGLGCFLPLDWRLTEDLDVTVLASLQDYSAQLNRRDSWKQDARITQRWYSPSNVRVDVLPVGADGAPSASLRWPGEDRILSTVGLRLVDAHAVEILPRDDLTIRVAPVSVITVLKMISYLDRPGQRLRDLQDLAHILTDYPEPEARFADIVIDRGLGYDQSGPFILGREIADLDLAPIERDHLDRFVALVGNDDVVAGRIATAIGHRDVEQTRRLAEALRIGIGSAE